MRLYTVNDGFMRLVDRWPNSCLLEINYYPVFDCFIDYSYIRVFERTDKFFI